MNPFNEKPIQIEKTLLSWKDLAPTPYNKYETDPYTKVRIILMNGTEFESARFQHAFARHCSNNDLRRDLAYIRRCEQQQQKKIAGLKPYDETILEHTLSYEQVAVDLTAILAKREKDAYVKQQLDFALLEDFDHLYRFSDLLEMDSKEMFDRLIGHYTEIMPGRPTISEHRHPFDDIKRYVNFCIADPVTKLNIGIIIAAEQQTMNYYMNVANFYPNEMGRKVFSEIAMIEEQHVSGYESLHDTEMTWLSCWLMHEYTECYLYYSCYQDETDKKIKEIWGRHYQQELSHLHYVAKLLKKYEGKEWWQVIPDGDFPELLKFHENKEYIRGVLKSVRLTAVREGFEDVDKVRDDHEFFKYQKMLNKNVNGVASHAVIDKYIKKNGKDLRYEVKPHPDRVLQKRDVDNVELGRVKGV